MTKPVLKEISHFANRLISGSVEIVKVGLAVSSRFVMTPNCLIKEFHNVRIVPRSSAGRESLLTFVLSWSSLGRVAGNRFHLNAWISLSVDPFNLREDLAFSCASAIIEI